VWSSHTSFFIRWGRGEVWGLLYVDLFNLQRVNQQPVVRWLTTSMHLYCILAVSISSYCRMNQWFCSQSQSCTDSDSLHDNGQTNIPEEHNRPLPDEKVKSGFMRLILAMFIVETFLTWFSFLECILRVLLFFLQLGVCLDETVTPDDLNDLMWMFGCSRAVQDTIVNTNPQDITEGSFLGTHFQRESSYLQHPVFNS